MTDITWQAARDKVRERWPSARCEANPDKHHSVGLNFAIIYGKWFGASSWVATEELAWLDALARMTSPQPDAQPTELPPHWCKILEPNNPDFSEKFACNDCGENFITMCSYARLKATLQAERTLREQTEAIVTSLREELATERSAIKYIEEARDDAHRFGMQWHQLWLLNSGKKFNEEEWAAEYVTVFNGQSRAETAEAENTRLRDAAQELVSALGSKPGYGEVHARNERINEGYFKLVAALSPAEGKGGQA